MVQTGDNMMALKRGNRTAVLMALHSMGAMSRKRLAAYVHLTPAAITKIVSELIGEGLVHEGASLPAPNAGRREVQIQLVPEARCGLGILIDRRAAILSGARIDGTLVFSERVEIAEDAPAEETVRLLCRRLMELAANLPRERLLGVGIAVRGVTDAAGRRSQNSMGALSAGEQPLADWVERETGLHAYLMNNVRALLAAQMFFTRDTTVRGQYFLRCEYGIGAAMSANSGCLETVASPMALCADARALLSPTETPVLWKLVGSRPTDDVPLNTVLMAAAHGDTAVDALVEQAVEYLAQAIRSVIYIVDPDKTVLYGGIFENPYFLSRLLAQIREGVDADRVIRVEKSPFNGQLEDIAAPLIAVSAFFRAGGMIA